MMGFIKNFSWTDKPTLTKEIMLGVVSLIGLLVAFIKLRPYFSEDAKVVTVTHSQAESHPTSQRAGKQNLEAIKSLDLEHQKAPDRVSRSRSGYSAQGAPQARNAKTIIERPLFDGLTITLKAALTNSITSYQPESPIEAQVVGVVLDDTTREIDPGPTEQARLIGHATANMTTKRMGLSFRELISREGRSYAIVGYAFEPGSNTVGVAANYSSGLGSRLLGVGIDRAINAADQIAMGKLFDSTTDNNVTARELQRASMDMSQQASMNIAAEATKDLRETAPELSLTAGTPITIKIKASQTGGGSP